MLAAQPPRSVAIASIGILTNLAALLRSPPDAHSPLPGAALVAEKARHFCGALKSESCFQC